MKGLGLPGAQLQGIVENPCSRTRYRDSPLPARRAPLMSFRTECSTVRFDLPLTTDIPAASMRSLPPEAADLELHKTKGQERQQAEGPPLELAGSDGPDDVERDGGKDKYVGRRGHDVRCGSGGESSGSRGVGTPAGAGAGGELGGVGRQPVFGRQRHRHLHWRAGKERFPFDSREAGNTDHHRFRNAGYLTVLKTEGDGGPRPSVSGIVAEIVALGDRYRV